MAQYPNLEFGMDSQGKYGAVQPFHNGNAFALPELNGSSIAVPVSSVALAANATFTGTTRDRLNLTAGATAITGGIALANQPGILISKIKGIVFADQSGTLYIEESNDGNTWTQTSTTTVTASTFTDSGWVYLSKRYYRLRYVNGATAQTTFSLFDSAGAGQNDTQLSGSNALIGNTQLQLGNAGGVLFNSAFLGDNQGGTNFAPFTPFLFNESGYDHQRNNTQGTLLASAARTANVTSPMQTNYNARGVIIVLKVTVAPTTPGTGSGLGLYIVDGDSGIGLTPSPTNVTTTGNKLFAVYPGISSPSNLVSYAGIPLPRNWQIVVYAGNTDSYTYEVDYSLIL